MMDDAELLRRYVRDGKEEAFTELVNRHLNLVFRAAWRETGGDAHRAEDVSQMVFTLLARKAAILMDHTSLTGWLYVTTHNTVRDVVREERRRQRREQEAQMMHDQTTKISDSVWNRLQPVLDQAMRTLGAVDRDAILLRYFEGRSLAEIGRILKLSEDGSRMRIGRALERLRAALARLGVTSTAAALSEALASEATFAAPAGLAGTVTGIALLPGSVAPAVGFFVFMSTNKIISTLAVAVLAIALGSALFEWKKADTSKGALTLAEREEQALVIRIGEAERRARISRGEVIGVQESVTYARATIPPDQAEREAEAAGRTFLAAHPEVKNAWNAAQRAQIAGQYHLLFQELGLTEAQVEEFEQIILAGEAGAARHYSHTGGLTMVLRLGEKISNREQADRLLQLWDMTVTPNS
ncbi:MAG: sigma-70 family RNA polymerase sigma factor [Opitutaceae bacterium]